MVLQVCLPLAKILGGESVSLAKGVGGESVSLAKGSGGERVGGGRGSGERVSGEKVRWRKGLWRKLPHHLNINTDIFGEQSLSRYSNASIIKSYN